MSSLFGWVFGVIVIGFGVIAIWWKLFTHSQTAMAAAVALYGLGRWNSSMAVVVWGFCTNSTIRRLMERVKSSTKPAGHSCFQKLTKH